jgi:hypothetical protein
MAAPALAHLRALAERVERFLLDLTGREASPHTKKLFRLALASWALLSGLLLLPYAGEIYSPDAFTLPRAFDAGRPDHWFGRLSLHPALRPHYLWFAWGQIGAALLALSGRWPRLSVWLLCFFTLNVFSMGQVANDGGNNLVEVLLLYLVFVNTSGRAPAGGAQGHESAAPGLWRAISVGASNVAFTMCRIQIAIVYVCAGIYKLNGALWQNGMALYYILQHEAYAHPLATAVVTELPALAMVGTYFAVVFQFVFPTLIWFSRTRPYLIAAGVALHGFGIAFGMGLFLFGVAMCLVYTAFVADATAARLLRVLTAKGRLVVRADFERLSGLRAVLARLNVFGTLRFEHAPGAALTAEDEDLGRTDRGADALLRIGLYAPPLLPLYPVLFLAWYVGLVGRAYGRLTRATGESR